MKWRGYAISLGMCSIQLSTPSVQAAPIPIETFAARDAISDVAISPDGRYLATVSALADRRAAQVLDLKDASAKPHIVLSDVPGKFDISWCRWATNSRLVCSYRGIGTDVASPEEVRFVATRLVAVDPDGSHLLVLLQNSEEAGGQFQDQVIDWRPGKADTVLIQAEESVLDAVGRDAIKGAGGVIGATTSSGYPAIFELNVVTGGLHLLLHSFPPALRFLTDFHGTPRVAYGVQERSTTVQYFVRTPGGSGWHHLLKYEAFARGELRTPIAIDAANPSRAYAIGDSGGRQALWSIDLNDVDPPQLIYANDTVDVAGAEFLKDGKLAGVEYSTDRPHMFYTDPKLGAIMRQLDTALSTTTNRIVDCTEDLSLCVVHSTGDVQPGLWFIIDTATRKLTAIGRTNPMLDPEQLGHMQPISYKARDGTMIPGYLTTPPDAPAQPLPLVVMPHGGPIARDVPQYLFLQQFLVNRGYAVLQMNFRGSSGYGQDWFYAAHQDWGGLTYDDIIDGTRWAVASGIADPHRIAIVGWSFGGYAALLGAVRDSDQFRCAVSIAGISDLGLLRAQDSHFITGEIAREQIGGLAAKLQADSPRRHARDLNIPILMFHGDMDPQVNVEQSRAMAAALRSAGKSFDFVEIKGADHQIINPKDRLMMMHKIEDFLAANLKDRVTQ